MVSSHEPMAQGLAHVYITGSGTGQAAKEGGVGLLHLCHRAIAHAVPRYRIATLHLRSFQ